MNDEAREPAQLQQLLSIRLVQDIKRLAVEASEVGVKPSFNLGGASRGTVPLYNPVSFASLDAEKTGTRSRICLLFGDGRRRHKSARFWTRRITTAVASQVLAVGPLLVAIVQHVWNGFVRLFRRTDWCLLSRSGFFELGLQPIHPLQQCLQHICLGAPLFGNGVYKRVSEAVVTWIRQRQTNRIYTSTGRPYRPGRTAGPGCT